MVTVIVEIKKKNTTNFMILNNLRVRDFFIAMRGIVIIDSFATLRKFLFL